MAKKTASAGLPPLSNDAYQELGNALEELECISDYHRTEAEVALDNLAGVLTTSYLGPTSKLALSFYEVIDELNRKFKLPRLILKASDKLQQLIEDTYDDDDSFSVGEAVKECADLLSSELSKIITKT